VNEIIPHYYKMSKKKRLLSKYRGVSNEDGRFAVNFQGR
jgi:hypothetical protein